VRVFHKSILHSIQDGEIPNIGCNVGTGLEEVVKASAKFGGIRGRRTKVADLNGRKEVSLTRNSKTMGYDGTSLKGVAVIADFIDDADDEIIWNHD
jgi:5,10-methenyltetrahydromethanopterin hydrogenase